MSAPNHDLPLLDLFDRLRRDGLRLSIADYMVLLRALQGGYGLDSLEQLKQLCRALWVKAAAGEAAADMFEATFDDMIIDYRRRYEREKRYQSESIIPEVTPSYSYNNRPQPIAPTQSSPLLDLPITSAEDLPTSLGMDLPATEFPEEKKMLPEEKTGWAVSEAGDVVFIKAEQTEPGDHSLELVGSSDEYFPVTRRQMQQLWRFLSFLVHEGTGSEIDISATIRHVADEGRLVEPVPLRPVVNHSEVLLLIDQGGSMAPFHEITQRLVQSARQSGKLDRLGVYYFRNWPQEYLYRTPEYADPIRITTILGQLRYRHTAALIVSDGGAARGRYSLVRLQATERLLRQLRRRVRHIAWLNLLPPSRWVGTTAAAVANRVPMFEFGQRGLYSAIQVLRGRPASAEAG